jgi:hypothetical protein
MDDITYGNPDFKVTKKQHDGDNPVVADITTCFEDWRSARSSLEESWMEYYRSWRCIQDAQDSTRSSERSQLKIPATKEAVNNAADSMFEILFAPRPYFRIQPQYVDLTGFDPALAAMELNMRAQRAEKIGKYIAYLHQREHFQNKVHQAIIEGCLYGTVIGRIIAKPRLNKSSRKRRIEQPIKGPDGQVFDVIETNTVDNFEQRVIHPFLQHVPLENFYIDPSATEVNEGKGVIVRSWQKRFQLNQLKAEGVIDLLPGEESTPENDELRHRKQAYMGLEVQTTPDDVELLEYWGWMDAETLDKVGFKDYDKDLGGTEICAIIADKQWLLKLTKNPHYSGERPFVKANFEKVPGEFYGIGIGEISSGPQRALDATVRSRLDNKALSINTMYGINVDKFLPGQNLKTYPGKAFLFRGDPREALMPMVTPDVTGGSYQEAIEYERYIQSAHGISRMVGGMPSKRGEQTATEISQLMGAANTRLKMLVKSFEDDFIAPALRWYTRIILQNMDSTEMFTMLDNESGAVMYESITPEDIAEDFDFVPQGSYSLNSQQELQRRISFLQLTANPVDMQFVNRQYLLKKIYETFDFDDNDVAVLGQVPPQQQALAQQQQPGGTPGQPSAQVAPPAGPAAEQPGTQLELPAMPLGEPTSG